MTLKVGFAEVGIPRTTVRAAQGAEGSFKPFETSVGHNRGSREHLDTFETITGDCLLLEMLRNVFDRK